MQCYERYHNYQCTKVLRVLGELKESLLQGSARLPVTQCGLEERQICAEDHCQVVEGEPQCSERTVENTVEVPEETCSLEPTTECKNETIR